MKYFIANWKANMTQNDVEKWVHDFALIYRPQKDATFIICPPYLFIPFLYRKLHSYKQIFLGSQDISQFDKGSYTGEVSAFMLNAFISYTIIGHSERRKNLNENFKNLEQKVLQAKKYGIEPIFCIRDENDKIPDGVKFVAYEPVNSIGTGQNESLANILKMKKKLRLKKNIIFIYGGSVTVQNVKEYAHSDEIHGFLVGKASLDAGSFFSIHNS